MKLVWLSTAILFLSVNAFATCPAGMQGSSNFDEGAATVDRMLGQHVTAGSHAIEIATDGKPLKIDFDKRGSNLVVTVWRSTGGRPFNTKQLSAVADVCSGGGQVKLEVNGYEVNITKAGGGKLAVSVAGYGPYTFAAISTSTEVATGPSSNR